MIIVPQTSFSDAISGNRNWSSSSSWDLGTIPDSHIAQVTLDNPQASDTTLTVDGVYHIEGLTMNVTGGSNFTLSNGANSARYLIFDTPLTNKTMTLVQAGSTIPQRIQTKIAFARPNSTLNIQNSGTGFHTIGGASSTTQTISATNLTINILSGGTTLDSVNSTINGGTVNISGGSLNYRYNSQALGIITNPMNVNYDNMVGSNLTFNNFTAGTLNTIPNNFNLISSRNANISFNIFGSGAVEISGTWTQSSAINGNLQFLGETTAYEPRRYYKLSNNMSGLTFASPTQRILNNSGGVVVVNTTLPNQTMRIGQATPGSNRPINFGFRLANGRTITNNIEVYNPTTAFSDGIREFGCFDVSGSGTYSGQILLNNNSGTFVNPVYLMCPTGSTTTYSQLISGSATSSICPVNISGSGTAIIGLANYAGTTTINSPATLDISGTWNATGQVNNSGTLKIPATITVYGLNCSATSDVQFNSSGSTIDLMTISGNITADGTLSFPDTSLNTGNYDIITWSGTLTDNGFAVGTNNTGKTLALTTDTINKKITLGVT